MVYAVSGTFLFTPRLSTVTVTFDVKERSATLFPVLLKSKVVCNCQPAADNYMKVV